MTYKIGDIVEGIVTGIQPYGAFVYIDTNNKGLIHISEISIGFVKDVSNFLSINEKIKVKIIDIDEESGQFKLSLKAIDGMGRRARTKIKRNHSLPKMNIGFKTLADNLDKWIKEANK